MRRDLIPLLFALALAGCPQDTTLRVAPPPLADDDDDDGGGGGGGGGGWPGLPELPPGPWGQLDPGEMPDVHFVVAWTDEGCCVNCDGLWLDEPYETMDEPEEGEEQTTTGWPESDWGLGCAARYAVIDLFGQVIAELAPPGQDETMLWTHTSLAPSGPGRFMAASQGYTIYLPDPGGEQPPEDGPIDTYVPWAAWEFDLVNNRVDEVARQSQDLRLTVQPSGRTLDLPAWETHAVLDPQDPDWLYVWSGSSWSCDQPTPSIRAIHRVESGLIGPRFDGEDLLGPDLDATGPFVPRSLQPSVDEEGNPRLFARLDSVGCDALAPVYVSTAFDPWGEHTWRAEDAVWPGMRPTYAGWGGGAFLTVDVATAPATWRVQGPEQDVTGEVPGTSWNVRPGPMLDPAGPTFAVLMASDQPPYGDSLVVFHGGQEVWRIDSLRFGLQERQLTFQDVIVLPPQVEVEVEE